MRAFWDKPARTPRETSLPQVGESPTSTAHPHAAIGLLRPGNAPDIGLPTGTLAPGLYMYNML